MVILKGSLIVVTKLATLFLWCKPTVVLVH